MLAQGGRGDAAGQDVCNLTNSAKTSLTGFRRDNAGHVKTLTGHL
jgi:hypothetical protein